MRLAVFGATGGTGMQVVAQALDRGHHVVALARRPDAIGIENRRLRVVAGDVLSSGAADAVVDGTDAVVSALGIGYRRHATTVYSDGTANVLAAMKTTGVRRLLVVSTSSLHLPDRSQIAEWLVTRFLLHPMLRRPYADMTRMEQRVRSSDVDWTLVRAARLTNGAAAGTYRTASHTDKLPGCWSISRADLAGYLLDQIADNRSHRDIVEIAR
ncbi:MAG TPA: SDR family oxidoreductase [Pseudonocardiaceae bacterium]